MQDKMCVHCFVSGLVQGVWFRAATEEQATRLGLTGWVRNLPDGRVEVLGCGAREQVLALCEWLKHGPTRAKVSGLTVEELEWKDYGQFVIT